MDGEIWGRTVYSQTSHQIARIKNGNIEVTQAACTLPRSDVVVEVSVGIGAEGEYSAPVACAWHSAVFIFDEIHVKFNELSAETMRF